MNKEVKYQLENKNKTDNFEYLAKCKYAWFLAYKGQATLCVQSAQSRKRSSDIALLRSLKQCSADREYTCWATLAQYAKTQSRTNASDIAHFVRLV